MIIETICSDKYYFNARLERGADAGCDPVATDMQDMVEISTAAAFENTENNPVNIGLLWSMLSNGGIST
ncbi:MAG: hypothetical protein ABI476_01665 [Oxalobacteraceae bacterium]